MPSSCQNLRRLPNNQEYQGARYGKSQDPHRDSQIVYAWEVLSGEKRTGSKVVVMGGFWWMMWQAVWSTCVSTG